MTMYDAMDQLKQALRELGAALLKGVVNPAVAWMTEHPRTTLAIGLTIGTAWTTWLAIEVAALLL